MKDKCDDEDDSPYLKFLKYRDIYAKIALFKAADKGLGVMALRTLSKYNLPSFKIYDYNTSI